MSPFSKNVEIVLVTRNVTVKYSKDYIYFKKSVLVLSDHEVNAFPLERCSSALTCGDCVALQDPYCAWDLLNEMCMNQRYVQ